MPVVRFYIRMSSKKQDNSPEAQKLEMSQWIVTKKDAPQQHFWYCDLAIIGDKPFGDRLEGARLLEDLDKGDWVVAIKTDRIGRNTRDILNTVHTITQLGGRLFILDFCGMEFDASQIAHQVMLNVGAMFAQIDNKLRSERVISTNKYLRAAGRAINEPRYGMQTVLREETDSNGKVRQLKYVEPEPREQAVLNHVREWWAKGVFATEIARRLNSRGYRNRPGHPINAAWVFDKVRDMQLSRAKIRRREEDDADERLALHNGQA